MAPSSQGQAWSETLCCPSCSQLFGAQREPVSASCSHVFCRPCALTIPGSACPLDQVENGYLIRELPTNSAILSVVGVQRDAANEISALLKKYGKDCPSSMISSCERGLISLASYLRRTNSERGGSVWSEVLSRTIQRKLVSVLCTQIIEAGSRLKLIRTLRALAERILCEQLLQQQASHSLSTQLWTTVRARGCQFLGPAMQEDVLKLILLTLSKGALIARKTLVMYIVQTLGEDYPQVSKTCVGHVVQLLYRASCFNVIKRDGESSLMQLKEEFRTYEALRREHDSQIVGMAVDAGLRISPDQWSALLYGDQHHRSHMQSIIDKLQSPQSFAQGIEELKTAPKNVPDAHKSRLFKAFEDFEKINDDSSWEQLAYLLEQMNRLLDIHVDIMIHRREAKPPADPSRRLIVGQSTVVPNERRIPINNNRFKSRIDPQQAFPHPPPDPRMNGPPHPGLHSQPPPPIDPSRMNPNMPWNGAQLIPELQAMTLNPMVQMSPFGSIPIQQGPMSQQEAAMMPMMVPIGGSPAMQMIGRDGQNVGLSMPPPPPPLTPGPPMPQSIVMMGQQPEVLMQPPLWNGRQVIGQGSLTQPPPPVLFSAIPQPMSWMPSPGGDYPGEPQTVFWPGPQIQMVPTQPIGLVQPMPMMMGSMDTRNDAYLDKLTIDETELLHLRRIEILNRLVPLSTSLDEDGDEGDCRGHVSYTVASSVFDDPHPSSLIGIVPIVDGSASVSVEFSAIPSNCSVFSCSADETISMAGEVSSTKSSVIATGSMATVRTAVAGPTGLDLTARPATVQADCTMMTVKDAIRQPLAAPIITPHVTAHIGTMIGNPNMPPLMIRPLETPMTVGEAQHLVSQTLDKIVDVKERLTEGGPGSSVESEQLRVELLIADRQMEVLDPQTQQTCLLMELQEVEKKIGELEGNVMIPIPITTAPVSN